MDAVSYKSPLLMSVDTSVSLVNMYAGSRINFEQLLYTFSPVARGSYEMTDSLAPMHMCDSLIMPRFSGSQTH